MMKAGPRALAAMSEAAAVAGNHKSAAGNGAMTGSKLPVAVPAAGFQVVCTGQIEGIDYPGVNNLYCRYAVTYGTDWRVLHGAEAGLSQLAYRSNQEEGILLNFPIDISFQTTNPFGWPRLVLSVYGLDGLGRDVIRGYGAVHIPTTAGRTKRQVPLFKPLSSSLMQQFTAWLAGSPPEYFDSKFITQNDGREVTRVSSAGKATVVFNVARHGMTQFGYT
ncbi:TPA: LOW QUALITY PROTEIN: hypothetical protein N0F65_009802 [Lagenidium giganteum]|uniref:B9 domain-containing protein 1 n=1 Tax=Lagenidium giganteum TaxID=4803 RepID=A0AAV2YEA6_9STRA|nr:TPA: LOW QUALITY PROTEIN: hypothetical protein N0F65_009802 [Lagenidium giganteum]